jgi:hypothetical protein
MLLDLFRKEIGFENIHGYDDIKDIVKRALDAEDNYNLLFIGPPASAKTLFLLGIIEYKKGAYFDGSNTTNRILDVLEEKMPKIICIDELDKMRKQYDFKIKGAKVFAACNEITRLSRPLRSRFRRLHLPPYTEEQFLEVSVKVLLKLKIAHVIGKTVWDQRGDIRDVISIGKLVRKNDGPLEIESMLSTMNKYAETPSRKSGGE